MILLLGSSASMARGDAGAGAGIYFAIRFERPGQKKIAVAGKLFSERGT